MVRRVKIETKINHERWLVSYSDFITLLFAFFVVMYSVSQVSETKYRTLSQTLEKTFSPQHEVLEEGQDHPANVAQLNEVTRELEQAFAGMISAGQLSLSGNEDWVELAVNSELLFESGSAKPGPQAVRIFSEVAGILAPFDNAVAVSGHTDNVPINTPEFQNNWQLSSARAVSVVDLLAYDGVDPSRLSAVGYGQYRPVADNATPEGRAANRRVVLRVARDVAPASEVAPQNVLTSGGSAEETNVSTELQVADPGSEPQPAEDKALIEPIKLKNGGLLFTNDPDLPQHRRRVE